MDKQTGRYAALTKRLVDSVLAAAGHTASELRRAVIARAAGLGGRAPDPAEKARDGVPAPLAGYVDKVARHAYKVTDQDLAALKQAGHSDDVLFEITVSAALGAALGRLERGLSALREASPPDPLSTTTWRGGTQDKR
jgi:alkylhydroperoxidase family enzyme